MKIVRLYLLWLLLLLPVVALLFVLAFFEPNLLKVFGLKINTGFQDIKNVVGSVKVKDVKDIAEIFKNISYDALLDKLSIVLSYKRMLLMALGALALAAFIPFLIFYLLSDRILLRWYRARELDDVAVRRMVEEVAKKADIYPPEVFVADLTMPNAFALGSERKGKIVLTKALIDLLDEDELKAVIAREIVHIRSGDSLISSNVAALAGIITSLSTLAFWASLLTGFGQEDDPAPNLIKLFVMSLVAPAAALIIHLMVSGKQEYLADKQCVELCEKEKLISALEKMDKAINRCKVNPAHSHLFVVNPLKEESVTILDFRIPTYSSLFSLQPSVSQRIKALRGEVEKKSVKVLRPTSFSLMSHMVVLFAIVAADTFNRKDFDFVRAATISTAYMGALFIFLLLFFIVFFVRLRSAQPVEC